MPATYPINASPRHQLTTTKKKVRTTTHTRVDNGHLLANRYAFTRPHARKKETHEVVDERIKKNWPKIQWWTIINA
jgi:hypothetical protein